MPHMMLPYARVLPDYMAGAVEKLDCLMRTIKVDSGRGPDGSNQLIQCGDRVAFEM